MLEELHGSSNFLVASLCSTKTLGIKVYTGTGYTQGSPGVCAGNKELPVSGFIRNAIKKYRKELKAKETKS